MPGISTKYVHGGSPQAPGDWNRDQIQAGVTMLQPSAIAFRLSDALQKATYTSSSNAGDITQIQNDIAILQGQVQTLSTQMTTLQGQVQAQQLVLNSFNYLQAEVSTHTTFLDQRTIYRRSFVLNGALATALTNFIYAHTVANISYIVNVEAMASLTGNPQYPIPFVNMPTAPSLSTGISCWADNTNIIISVGTTAFANYQVLVTMWYTCTDR